MFLRNYFLRTFFIENYSFLRRKLIEKEKEGKYNIVYEKLFHSFS